MIHADDGADCTEVLSGEHLVNSIIASTTYLEKKDNKSISNRETFLPLGSISEQLCTLSECKQIASARHVEDSILDCEIEKFQRQPRSEKCVLRSKQQSILPLRKQVISLMPLWTV